jgi:hypothetical protein
MHMSEVEDQFENNQLDRAVANRLSKLRTRPVDTSRLDQALRGQIPFPSAGRVSWLRLRPLRAVAASIAVLLIISALLLTTATGPAMASPTQMAQFHQDLVAGRTPVMQVDSIQAANQALNEQWPQSPQLPSVPAQHVMACCMKSVRNKKVACVLLKDAGVPITMTVANASDMRTPSSQTVTRGGVSYSVQAVGSLNMVMTERNGRWICLIGELPAERLMDLAMQLQF